VIERGGRGRRAKDYPREDGSEHGCWEKTRGISWGMSVGGESSKFPPSWLPRSASAERRLLTGDPAESWENFSFPRPMYPELSACLCLSSGERSRTPDVDSIACRWIRVPTSSDFSRETSVTYNNVAWRENKKVNCSRVRCYRVIRLLGYRGHDIMENNNALSGCTFV